MAKPLLLIGLLCAACDARDALAPAPTLGPTEQIVPGPGLPPEYGAVAGPSNNNLDVARHEGRVFLATRTAPDHFASPEARLFVFSSSDEKTWRFEAVFHRHTDLREPRLLSFKGRLFLYFAELGTDSARFEPKGMYLSEYLGPGRWSDPVGFYAPGETYIPWRAKTHDGRAYMTVYKDGQHIYDFSGGTLDVELLVSDDGAAWTRLGVVSTGGGSETDFAFDEAGDLYAVIRNERGDEEFGWGSKICRAKKDDLARWTCKPDPKKYDSPAVFALGDVIFLVGRRNMTETGDYQLADVPWSLPETASNLIDYSNHRKHCALWQVDRKTLTVRLVVEVPGWGDTCFPALVEDLVDPRTRILYNYSSPLDAPEPPTWIAGQRGETRIYRTPLVF